MDRKLKLLTGLLIAGIIVAFTFTMIDREPVSHAQTEAQLEKPLAEQSEWFDDAKRQLEIADDMHLIAAVTDDLTGDGEKDTLLLIGEMASDDETVDNIDLILRDGKSGKFTAAELSGLAGLKPGLFFADYNNDNIKDILVTATGRDGLQHAMVSFANGKAETLFSGGSAREIVAKQMKSQYATVSYPQINADSRSRQFVNQAFEAAASELVSRATAQHPLNVGYTVVRSDAALISVIFTDEQDISKPILQSVTVNLRNQRTITLDNLISANRQTQQDLAGLIASTAKMANIADVPALNEWTGVYLTAKDIVLYQQEPGKAPKLLTLPLEKARPFLSRSARGQS